VPRRYLVRRLIATAVLLSSLAAAASVFALVNAAGVRSAPMLKSATGAMSESNSTEGNAIFTVSNTAPGHSTEGTVRIGNTGTVPGTLVLSTSSLSDTPGPNSGALSGVLRLQIDDISSGAAQIYSGNLADMPDQSLGTLAAGETRSYRFVASLPDPLTSDGTDNLYQGSAAGVDYNWTLTQASDDPPPPDPAPLSEPSQPPAPPACASRLIGSSANDTLIGTSHGDTISAKTGDDLTLGEAGDDCLQGDAGADSIHGGAGNDRLQGGAGPDQVLGDSGNDVIYVRDHSRDLANCGTGVDTVFVDRRDRTTNCETIHRG
jgi:Ca2+-binding RTX toxin-like protein